MIKKRYYRNEGEQICKINRCRFRCKSTTQLKETLQHFTKKPPFCTRFSHFTDVSLTRVKGYICFGIFPSCGGLIQTGNGGFSMTRIVKQHPSVGEDDYCI